MATKYIVKDSKTGQYLRKSKGSDGIIRYAEENIEDATIFNRRCDATNSCKYWYKSAVVVKVKVKIKD